MSTTSTTKNSQYYIDLENKHGAHNYHPLPVVLEKGEGVFVWKWDIQDEPDSRSRPCRNMRQRRKIG